jgi:hypothetical protein
VKSCAPWLVATQETAVTELPQQLQGGNNDLEITVPPLPFGSRERKIYCADGAQETATGEQLGIEGDDEEHDLYFHDPFTEDAHKAQRPVLPLRNTAGAIVDEDAWKDDVALASKDIWKRPISACASGTYPEFRHADIPSEEWIREMCKDARDLVVGCGIHVCGASCFKYHSSKASQICRHNYYHKVTLFTEDEEHEQKAPAAWQAFARLHWYLPPLSTAWLVALSLGSCILLNVPRIMPLLCRRGVTLTCKICVACCRRTCGCTLMNSSQKRRKRNATLGSTEPSRNATKASPSGTRIRGDGLNT